MVVRTPIFGIAAVALLLRNDIFLTRHREHSVAIPAIEVGAACIRTPIFGIATVALLLRNDGVRYTPVRVVCVV